MVDPAKLITVAEAAKLCDLSEPAIRARINDGRLMAIRIGGSIYLDADVFDAFLSRTAPAAK